MDVFPRTLQHLASSIHSAPALHTAAFESGMSLGRSDSGTSRRCSIPLPDHLPPVPPR